MKVKLDEGAYMPERVRKKISIGDRIDALIVVSETGMTDKQGNKLFRCLCDCGNILVKSSRYLNRADTSTKSCGCGRGKANVKHGYASRRKKIRLYRIWMAMKWRTNSKNKKAKTYREKGVKCCHGDKVYCTSNDAYRWWVPMKCRCGGILSEKRTYHYKGGPIKELSKYDGRVYRHCYACHSEFFEEVKACDTAGI